MRVTKTEFWKKLIISEDGPTAVEYAVILALIAGVCVLGITLVGFQSGRMWGISAVELDEVLNK